MRVRYFLSETLAYLRRNLLMTLAAISTTGVSLFLLGGTLVMDEIVKNVTGGLESQVEVNVFLRDDITPDQFDELNTSIAGAAEVRTHEYITKEQAFEIFKGLFAESPELVENVDPDTLPASFRIELKDPIHVEAVAARMEGQPGVDDVQFGGDRVKRLLTLTRVIQTLTLIFVLLLLASATLLIANTIRLAIYARRREIGIMKLVGATNWFVRVPFILEGMFQATVGAIVAGGVVYALKLGIDAVQAQLVFLPVAITLNDVFRIDAQLVGVGLVIGALGSLVALRRFLEV